ncbi:MAG: GH92 family glycosyl hydrolase [Candidatus Hadarchaeales archaeon]
MNREFGRSLVVMTIFLLIFISSASASVPWLTSPRGTDPVDYVDPFIGTRHGHTSPGAAVPFAMTTWDPVRKEQASDISYPYEYIFIEEGGRWKPADTMEIAGIRGSHFPSGSCMSDYACITIMPMFGSEVKTGPERSSRIRHETEIATPGYYAVTFDDYGIRVEVTSTMRVGLLRLTFENSGNAHILIDTHLGTGWSKIIPENNEIVGYSDVGLYRAPTGEFKGYYVVTFSKQFTSWGTYQGSTKNPGNTEVRAYNSGAWVSFPVSAGEVVYVKASISFISVEQARYNMQAEIPGWDFDGVRQQARQKWNQLLSMIRVEGGTDADKIKFYTALYHALLLPRVSSEYGKYFSVFDARVHTCDGWEFYNDFSMWDTFRALHALQIFLVPERVRDMMRSLVAMYEQGGWMPKWPNPGYSSIMIGTHGDSLVTEAYLKGITDFDVQKAYEAMVKNATQSPPPFYEARTGIEDYMTLGYCPTDRGYRESVSLTLEYAYDDWCIAQLAKALGKDNDYRYFMQRATNWRNVYNPEAPGEPGNPYKGYVQGRKSDGTWEEPFDPRGYYSYITQPNEGNPWQYTWFVPHDVQGLIDVMGKENFIGKLERLFEKSEEPSLLADNRFTEQGRVRYYWHGNEPSHHIAYLFVYAGAPWRTQYWVRNVLETRYRLGPHGLPGNDDCGQMSAWFIFSSMGFYPVCPPSLTYVIGSPIFDKITINLPSFYGQNKKFEIIVYNNSPTNIYVQSAKLNGQPLERAWLWHSEIINGGTLELWMGPNPNTSWGVSEPPPSMSSSTVSDILLSNFSLSANSISRGDILKVKVTVTNQSSRVVEKTLQLKLDGIVVDSRTVSLQPGESLPVVFNIYSHALSLGTHTIDLENFQASFVVGTPGLGSTFIIAIISVAAFIVLAFGFYVLRMKKGRRR